jgi:hypothetical protein
MRKWTGGREALVARVEVQHDFSEADHVHKQPLFDLIFSFAMI